MAKTNDKKNIWKSLFLSFMKIGLFTFGGGYAMIALIEDKCVEKEKWITHDEMMDITVVAESTPGPIAINCATFVGYKIAGLFGATMATLGVVIPSFVIILSISLIFDHFLEIPFIANAFLGIKVAVGLLIFEAGLNMLKKMKKNVLSRIIVATAFVGMLLVHLFSWNFSSIRMMLVAGLVSFLCFTIGEYRKGGNAK